MIKNRKYIKNKTNNGNVPTLPDRRIEYVPIGCGNCFECRRQKAREWQVRLMEDIKTNKNGKFITLTFSNESLLKLQNEGTIKRTDPDTGKIQTLQISNLKGYDRDNATATKATRLFNERWRKKYRKALRHWLVTELGHNGTERIHLHGIIWTDETYDTIRQIWQYGYIWPKPKSKVKTWVNNQTINYIVKYVNKVDPKHKEYKSIILTSPGIGANYINTNAAFKNMRDQTETYKTTTGHEIALPIYWRNKLFTDHDKETLWIKKLDKQIRYVDKVKYDISKTEKHYNNAVKDARNKNKTLGYGGRKNENRKQYEEQRREIIQITKNKNHELH